MSFLNTEFTTTSSGLGRIIVTPYADRNGLAYANSGAQTIASGAGVLQSVIGIGGSLLSGQAGLAPPSNSGASVAIIDAISGTTLIATSGGASLWGSNVAAVLYQFNFGIASGAGTGGAGIAPPDVTALNAIFRSGLVVICSGGTAGGYALSVIYSKGL